MVFHMRVVGWKSYWDGAISHTKAEVMGFLNTKFWGCIISLKAEVKWPSYSPNLNPLDYFFCNYAIITWSYEGE